MSFRKPCHMPFRKVIPPSFGLFPIFSYFFPFCSQSTYFALLFLSNVFPLFLFSECHLRLDTLKVEKYITLQISEISTSHFDHSFYIYFCIYFTELPAARELFSRETDDLELHTVSKIILTFSLHSSRGSCSELHAFKYTWFRFTLSRKTTTEY